jgi:hypothetical protein
MTPKIKSGVALRKERPEKNRPSTGKTVRPRTIGPVGKRYFRDRTARIATEMVMMPTYEAFLIIVILLVEVRLSFDYLLYLPLFQNAGFATAQIMQTHKWGHP